jgi:hypothetical protein
VQLGASLLGYALVRRLAYELVREPKCVLAPEVGPLSANQLFLSESDQVRRRRCPVGLGHELLRGADVEASALYRSVLKQGPFADLEAVEARSEHGLDARR